MVQREAAPLPRHIDPMLAVSASEPFDAPEKIFELKWDGVRAVAFISDGVVRLETRSHLDITDSFADVATDILRAVKGDGVVLDGELVSLDDQQRPRLPLVMQRFQAGSARRRRPSVSFEVFDILYKDNVPLLREPLWERKRILHETVNPTRIVHLCHFEEGEGVAFYRAVQELGLEGIVGKDKASTYQPGRRSKHWVKIKTSRTSNFVVGGYTFGGGRRKDLFGSLLLGAYDRKGLQFAGSVGGGFSDKQLKDIYGLIAPLHRTTSPFVDTPNVQRFLFWCDPRVVVRVKYGEITELGHLRFPIFTSLRGDIDPRECAFPS